MLYNTSRFRLIMCYITLAQIWAFPDAHPYFQKKIGNKTRWPSPHIHSKAGKAVKSFIFLPSKIAGCQRKFFLYFNLSHSTVSQFRNRRLLGRNRIPQAATQHQQLLGLTSFTTCPKSAIIRILLETLMTVPQRNHLCSFQQLQNNLHQNHEMITAQHLLEANS